MKCWRRIYVIGMLVILITGLSTFYSYAGIEDDMRAQVENTYVAALASRGVGSFVGICPSATGRQMLVLGLIAQGNSNDCPSANGNGWYSFYKMRNGSINSKGYRVVCAEGANCIQDLVNAYGMPLYNIVVSFPDNPDHDGNGHVMFIHAIIGNNVYFTDNFTDGSEGKVRVLSISQYNQYYQRYNGSPIGAVYFQPQSYAEGFTADGRYQNADGSYAEGWKQIGADWFYFSNGGYPVKNDWVNEGGKWYYLTSNGHMQTGWETIKGKKYYFYESGEMASGWLKLGGDYYYLGTDGAMQKRTWISEDDCDYYLGSDGKMYRNICATIDHIEYEFDNEGIATLVESQKPIDKTDIPEVTKPEKEETNTAQILYSYRTREINYEYTTSDKSNLSGWELTEQLSEGKTGSWSDWSEEYVDGTDEIEVETRTRELGTQSQIYLGRYYSSTKNNFSPDKLDNTYSFEGGWFDEDEVTFIGQAYAGGRSDCYKIAGYHYYFFEIGSKGGETREVSTGQITEYRWREKGRKAVYQYRRERYGEWSDWSEWSSYNPGDPTEIMQVRTKTL